MRYFAAILVIGAVAETANAQSFPIRGSFDDVQAHVRTHVCRESPDTRFGQDSSLALVAQFYRLYLVGGGRIGSKGKRFLGFVEGRLRLDLPAWWELMFERGRWSGGRIYFSWREARRLWTVANEWELSGLDTVSAHGKELTITKGDRSISLRKSLFVEFENVPGAWAPSEIGPVMGAIDESIAFVAFHGSPTVPTGPTWLYAIDRATNKLLWEVLIDNGIEPGLGMTGTYSGSYAEVVIVGDDRVAVFGGHDLAMYLHVFNKSNGEPLVRFATSHVMPPLP